MKIRSLASTLLRLASCALLTGAILPAGAQPYPSRPVRMVVPYAAGGGVDIVARAVGQELAKRLGQPVLVENRTGAGSNIGSDFVAKATPDGYTLLMASPANAINMSLYRKMPYDTQRDLAPVALVGAVPSVLVVNPSLPAKSVAELVALAKAKPGGLNYGSGGSGTSEHLSAEMFKSLAGVEIVHVPYKGGANAMTDVISGQLSLMFTNMLGAMPHLRSGKLKALGVAGAQRAAQLPDVPTFAEAGYKDFEVSVWWGVMAPAGTPAPVLAQLNREIVASLGAPELRERLDAMGARILGGTPEEFRAFIAREIERWARAVKASGATQD
jgi:tripartite-type tricarboxylate transporter receptor subunit TctC